MGRTKKVEPEVVAEVEITEPVEFQNGENVTEDLSVDPNDPRVVNPTVDGNSQPKVDINIPL